jgi:hypothetical protein
VRLEDPLEARGFEAELAEAVAAELVAGAEDVWLTLGLGADGVAALLVPACGAREAARGAAWW